MASPIPREQSGVGLSHKPRVLENGKVEVVELFSYGCPYSMQAHPVIADWAARKSGSVQLRRVPVGFGRVVWANLARLHYGLLGTGDLLRLESVIFQDIHRRRVNLYVAEAIHTWVAQHGVDIEAYSRIAKSISVATVMGRNEGFVKQYGVTEVPTLVVGGAHLLQSRVRLSADGLIAEADRLVSMALFPTKD